MLPAALFLDLNGVLYDQPGTPLPGAVTTVSWARQRGLPLRFVTNTATRHHHRILRDLAALGVRVEPGELFTAPLAARAWIRERGLTPHCLVHPAIRSVFADLEGQSPDCVLLGDARGELTYAALNRAFRLLLDGAPLIGLGMNRRFREGGQWMLDAGAFIQGLAWAAEVEPVVMGKPSAAFFAQLVADVGLPAEQCLMVGDDAEADVAAALVAGLRGCLVRTGKYRPGDERRCAPQALVIPSLAELPGALERG
ncbi:HAD-superfamily subfamily IIA hydrolase, TIGR01458 [Cyanobium sp. PCC 7001]|jgi:HAD superfamily hydrolase (TIGR01458 family)|uniref:TIGR01458 family HAD-type hydrolase n=1 Tax=Cyanobium sp. PCC 7001 TaxID=180281 RepID=UPI0001805BC2|nr:TIGR01458 family HAD-type hydrolase [Cyanobium sp. PCC 7001]EDY38616.1 HAD-superfamily subfamily IIA hydrolase, TIGR01458 [Cyanobium sp. PCC 7001]